MSPQLRPEWVLKCLRASKRNQENSHHCASEGINQDDSEHQKAVIAGTQYGSTEQVHSIIEADEHVAALPIPSDTKIDQSIDFNSRETSDDLSGWLNEPGFIEVDEEQTILEKLLSDQHSDKTFPRKMLYFGFSFHNNGLHPHPVEDIPEYLAGIEAKMERWLFSNDIPVQFDQCSVYQNEASGGVTPQMEPKALVEVIRVANLLSDVSMDFIPLGPGAPLKARLNSYCFCAFTGEARHRWKHGITARKEDMVDRTRVRRKKHLSVIF